MNFTIFENMVPGAAMMGQTFLVVTDIGYQIAYWDGDFRNDDQEDISKITKYWLVLPSANDLALKANETL